MLLIMAVRRRAPPDHAGLQAEDKTARDGRPKEWRRDVREIGGHSRIAREAVWCN